MAHPDTPYRFPTYPHPGAHVSRSVHSTSAPVRPTPDRVGMVAALFVETGGGYFGLPDVDPWDEARDARLYRGPHPVVAHPPCQRWGRYWRGSPYAVARGLNDKKKGDDGGCFEFTLATLREFGGVAEHPADSAAWDAFGLNKPSRSGGWVAADWEGGWTCYVEQGHYGHFSRKPTWLIAYHCDLPSLKWGEGEQRLTAEAIEKYGYEKARRRGVMVHVGGGGDDRERSATPPEFRELLLTIARSSQPARTS
jgi:hypothetical protein